MIKSRLIEIFSTFSKKEIRGFRKWINSTAHNQREDVIRLFEYLIENNNYNEEKLLKKELVYNHIYPNDKYDDAKMRQVIHFLNKCIESYLTYRELLSDEILNKLLLAKSLRKKKLEKAFLKLNKNTQKQNQEYSLQNESFFRYNYELKKEYYDFLSESKRLTSENLQEVRDSLDIFFIIEKLKHSCIILTHQSIYNIVNESIFVNSILVYIEENNLLKIPAIAVYYHLYQILIDDSKENNYNKLKKDLFKYSNLFSVSDIRGVYLIAINYCIKKLNKGEQAFLKEAWELHKNGIERNILIENGILNRFIYRNFISLGLKLKLYEEVEEYIFKYKELLEQNFQDSFFYFLLSLLNFEKGDYDNAMNLLNQYEHKDVLINLNAKTIQIKIYYELNEFKVLESLLESMRAYLQRKKVIGYHKEVYKNIIRYTKKLLKVNPYSRAQKEKLKAEIEAAKPLTEKAWLLKQLADL